MAAKVIVFMNGKARQVNSDRTVMEIVREMKLEPASVLVERNGEAMLRQEWGERKVEHSDRLEFVKVVAGGCVEEDVWRAKERVMGMMRGGCEWGRGMRRLCGN